MIVRQKLKIKRIRNPPVIQNYCHSKLLSFFNIHGKSRMKINQTDCIDRLSVRGPLYF